MTSPANDIVKQANQGSVAAIIQVLNDKLADSGVRTRAIFVDGILQLLCEAATVEQLEQSILKEKIRLILEAIAPRPIRKVNINSRIVREQQLLWLEEISRDPEQQLLWSEEITLSKPNPFRQLWQDWQIRKAPVAPSPLPTTRSTRQEREQRQLQRGLLGGTGLTLLVLAGVWYVRSNLSYSSDATQTSMTSLASNRVPNSANPPVAAPSASNIHSSNKGNQTDSFANAVRLAEHASQAGLTAKSSAEWLDLAARWQQASDLMANVTVSDQRYKTAQSRVVAYRKNRETALQQAKSRQVDPTSTKTATEPQLEGRAGNSQ
jgi:hypothetical protein